MGTRLLWEQENMGSIPVTPTTFFEHESRDETPVSGTGNDQFDSDMLDQIWDNTSLFADHGSSNRRLGYPK